VTDDRDRPRTPRRPGRPEGPEGPGRTVRTDGPSGRSGRARDTVTSVQVTFFGVRGSCPCAGDPYRRVGGNTSCVLVTVDGESPLVLDLGTGLRALGETFAPKLRAQGRPLRANALLTHLHFDHILGLPFFAPLHDPGASLTVYGPVQEAGGLQETLPGAVQPPFFPVHMTDFRGEIALRELGDEDLAIGDLKVRARTVPHPGNTLGFRIEAEGCSVAYLPDHQAPPDRLTVPDGVRELCEGADLVLHDAQYTDEEFVDKPDWGHSTVAYAVRVAAECGARRLLLFHHDPAHTDRDVEALLRRARHLPDARRLEDVSAATEGLMVDLSRW
jgi:phosphoribosyl 1,2-cyclic phosphodiesterase